MLFLLSLAFAEPCNLTTSAALSEALARWESTPPSETTLLKEISCLQIRIDVETARKLHTLMEQVASGAHKKAAQHALRGGKGSTHRLAPPTGWIQVDGIYATELPSDRAAVLQWMDASGGVRKSRYWWPGEDLGDWQASPPETRLRLELGADGGGAFSGFTGAGGHVGVGLGWKYLLVEVAGRGLTGVAGERILEGSLFGGLQFPAGPLHIGVGASWNAGEGRWRSEGPGGMALRGGLIYGPGAKIKLDLGENVGPAAEVSVWNTGEAWIFAGSVGVVLRIPGL